MLDLITTTENNDGAIVDVFTNGSGWNLPMVQNGAWNAPHPTLAYQPWQNSTSPLT